ncbi:MAG TPA: hypothetical protein VH307_16545 [Streptosporangiaceae bacterium]|nr:hypothetical protein [Streptosporangiaceae bacterium]
MRGQQLHVRRIVLGGVGDSVFASTDAEPVARAVETGQAAEEAGPPAAALAHFAMAPGNDRAALAACLRRPRAPLTEAEVARAGPGPGRPGACRARRAAAGAGGGGGRDATGSLIREKRYMILSSERAIAGGAT